MDFGKFNVDSFKTKEKVKKTEKGEDEGTQGHVKVKKTMGYHQMRRINSEFALEKELPWHFEKGDCYHCISMGDVDSLTYLRAIVKQQKVEYLILSTWCMARTDIAEMETWLDKGYIGKIDYYVGEIYTSRYSAEWETLRALCNRYGSRACLFRNHAKVMAGFGEQFDFVTESSANVNTNPRSEQTVITVDTDLALWYKEFYDGINSFDDTFKDWKPYVLERNREKEDD